MAVLPASPGLAHEPSHDPGGRSDDGLPVRHLGPADVGANPEFPAQPVDDDLEMQLAHPADDGLVGLLIGAYPEGRVLVGELPQSLAQLVLIGPGLGLDGDRNDRLRELHGLQDDRMVGVAQRMAGADPLESDDRRDVAGEDFLPLLALVRVHLQDSAHPLAPAPGRVEHVGPARQRPRIDAEEGEPPDIGVGGDLECERGEGSVVAHLPCLGEAARRTVVSLDGRDVDGGGQVVDDTVQERLDALVAEGRSAENGEDVAPQGGLADRPPKLFLRKLCARQVLLQQVIVVLDRRLDELVAQPRDRILHGIGHRPVVEAGAQIVLVDDRLHADDVHDAGEELALAERILDRVSVGPEPFAHHPDDLLEVGPDAVHLVDERDAGHAIAVGLAPYGLGLRLDATDRAEHGDGSVQNPQRTLDLGREVDVSGGVDDVDAEGGAVAQPRAGGGGGGNRDPPLLLLFHPVHGGRTFMHLAHAVDPAGIEQNPLGGGRLAGVDMRHDADVAQTL